MMYVWLKALKIKVDMIERGYNEVNLKSRMAES